MGGGGAFLRGFVMPKLFEVGQKVKYNAAHIRSTMTDGDTANLAGEVEAVRVVPHAENVQVVTVRWDDGNTSHALNCKLKLAGVFEPFE